MNNRIIKLRNNIQKNKINYYITDNLYNNLYIFGFNIPGIVTIISGSKIYFNCNDMLKSQLEKTIKIKEKYEFLSLKEYDKLLNDKNIGFDFSSSLSNYLCVKKYDLKKSKIIQNLRMIKDDEEIKKIKIAIKFSNNLYRKFISAKNKLKREIDYYNFMRYSISKQDDIDFSFKPIIASQYNSQYPHYDFSKIIIRNNENIMFDFGLKYKDYCSDITRMFIRDINTKKYFMDLKDIQGKIIDFIKPGKLCSEIDNYARNILTKYGYKDRILHSTGHSIGLEVHEAPSLSFKDDTMISEGMILTVEPGIYFKNKFGFRIEDMILVRDKKNIVLTSEIINTQ